MDGSANITTGGDNSCRSCCTPVAQFAEGTSTCVRNVWKTPDRDRIRTRGKVRCCFFKTMRLAAGIFALTFEDA